MIGSYGLGDSLISFRSLDTGVMGGNLVAKVLADGRSRKAVDMLLADAKHEATRLLVDHRYLVEALRDALLEREELIEDEILEVLRTAEAEGLRPDRVLVDLRQAPAKLADHRAPSIELIED